MNLETLNDATLRRYLLDDISDEERQTVEEQFLEDDTFFDDMIALEDELHYDYQQNLLSTSERAAFEQKFLQAPQDIEKSQFASAFLEATANLSQTKAESGSFWESVSAFFSFSNPSFRLGAALASLLLVFSIGFLLFNNINKEPLVVELPKDIDTETPISAPIDNQTDKDKQKEQAEIEKQIAEERQKRERDENKVRELEEQKQKIQREIEANRQKELTPQTPQKSFIALVLSPGLVRSDSGKIPKIKLQPEVKTLNLTLPIKKVVEIDNIRVVVRNADGGGEVLNSTVKKGKKNSISFQVPTKNLKRGDYEVVLIDPEVKEEIESYYFKIEK